MTISRILLGAFSAALLLPDIAHAEPVPDMCQSPQLRGRIVEYVIDGQQAAFELALHPDIMTLLRLPPQVRRVRSPSATDLMITTTPMGVTVQPTKASSGTFTVYGDISGHELAVTFSIRVVDDPAQAISTAIVRQRTASEPAQSIMRVIAQMQCNQHGPTLSQIIPGALNAGDMRTVDESVCDLLNVQSNVVRLNDRLPVQSTIGILARQYMRLGSKGYLKVELINREVVPFTIGTVQLFDQDRKLIVPSAIRIRAPRDQNSAMDIIPARNSVVGTIAITEGDLLTESFSLMVTEPDGGRTIWREDIRLGDLMPSPTTGDTIKLYTRPDGVDVWEFNPPDDNEGRITLDVQALYGAIWLSAGTGLDELGAASLSGLGVRVGYGINRLLTFEGAVVGARSGDVCFMTADGELERSVMLGRIYMGGLLRFGERVMPTARAGLGLQGASQRSTMVDGIMDDSAFELGFLFGAGIGLDVRLGKSLLLGAGISVEQNQTTDTISFESGIHLGYAWKP